MAQRILILYTEYAPYLHACLKKFVESFDYEVHVVRYPLDKNAPFNFNNEHGVYFYDRKAMSRNDILQLYHRIAPSVILVSGWIDKDYNSITRQFRKDGNMVIAVVDNQWVGAIRQHIFTYLGKYWLKKRFSHFWIPGITQFEYLRKIGIPSSRILTGFYSADSSLFLEKYIPHSNIPKRFIYVGRLLEIKGTETLIKAVRLLNQKPDTGWEILIIGNGTYETSVKELASEFNNVHYKPFMQPEELAAVTSNGGVFILPSNYDAWGVVVHEFALLGYPLILSSMVGSRNYFVTPGYNGYIFESRDSLSLVNAMEKIIALDPATLKKMSERSHLVGKTITTEAWACRLHESIQLYLQRN